MIDGTIFTVYKYYITFNKLPKKMLDFDPREKKWLYSSEYDKYWNVLRKLHPKVSGMRESSMLADFVNKYEPDS